MSRCIGQRGCQLTSKVLDPWRRLLCSHKGAHHRCFQPKTPTNHSFNQLQPTRLVCVAHYADCRALPPLPPRLLCRSLSFYPFLFQERFLSRCSVLLSSLQLRKMTAFLGICNGKLLSPTSAYAAFFWGFNCSRDRLLRCFPCSWWMSCDNEHWHYNTLTTYFQNCSMMRGAIKVKHMTCSLHTSSFNATPAFAEKQPGPLNTTVSPMSVPTLAVDATYILGLKCSWPMLLLHIHDHNSLYHECPIEAEHCRPRRQDVFSMYI